MKQLCSEVVKDLLDGDINVRTIFVVCILKMCPSLNKLRNGHQPNMVDLNSLLWPCYCRILEESDIKAAIAALSFILSSAAKYSVDGDSLDNELQQLGLPKGTLKHDSVSYCPI